VSDHLERSLLRSERQNLILGNPIRTRVTAGWLETAGEGLPWAEVIQDDVAASGVKSGLSKKGLTGGGERPASSAYWI